MKRLIAAAFLSAACLAGSVGIANACAAGAVTCYICQDPGCHTAVRGCCKAPND